MDLRQYLRILNARKYLVVATVVAALGVAATLALLPAREWAASSTLQVQPAAALTGGSVRPDDVSYVDRLINTYSEVVATPEFADSVARDAGLTARPVLAVKAPSNTNLISVEATASTAAAAAAAATSAGRELVARVQQQSDASLRAADQAFQNRATAIEMAIARAHVRLIDLRNRPQDRRTRETEVQLEEEIAGQRVSLTTLRNDHESQRSSQTARGGILTVVGDAAPPAAPVDRRLGIVLPLGLIFGLLAGCGLALTADSLSRRFRSEGEIEAALGAPVLATIRRGRRAGRHMIFSPDTHEHEAVRRVRTQLLMDDRVETRLVLMVSAEPGEGKSTLAANLACSVADAGRTVVVVDADLRRPTIHRFFDEDNDGGLSDLLTDASDAGSMRWKEWTRTAATAKTSILPAGPPVSDPPTLLGSRAMALLLNELAASFDMVIIDSPAILAVTDALVLAPVVDAVIVVVGSNTTPDALQLANEQLLRTGARPLGLVVNGTDEANESHYVDYEVTRS